MTGSASSFDSVEVRRASKVYGRQRALHPVDLTLRAGEATALLGPNGAGKSTLVGILSTLVRPTSGEVVYGGREPGEEVRRGIGVLAHESLCYGDLSARENVAFFARLYGVPEAGARAAELVERVGLAEAGERPSRTFSRGMMQRLAVARALAHRPQLLLLDEPFTGLDRSGVELLGGLLAEERRRGAILVVVTHDFDAVASLVDRVLVLRRGRLQHDGPAPAERSAAGLQAVYRAAGGSR